MIEVDAEGLNPQLSSNCDNACRRPNPLTNDCHVNVEITRYPSCKSLLSVFLLTDKEGNNWAMIDQTANQKDYIDISFVSL